jgi:putative dimethyl sulfoxide reductase chaperone
MNESKPGVSELAGIARARAAFSSFLNIHFNLLPDEKFVKRMRHKEVISMLQVLPKDESVNEDLATGASLMEKFLQDTRNDTPAQLSEKLGVDRTRLYRGLSPSYGPPPPYEMVWSKTWQEVTLLQVLSRMYGENGLGPSKDIIDRLDYIGLELEFLHALAMRETAAWEANETEMAGSLLEVQRHFFREHMEQWVPSYVEKALEWAKTDFYQGHLLMLRGFISDQGKIFSKIAPDPR